jgi:hypothetical protein
MRGRCRLLTLRPAWEEELAASGFTAELHCTGLDGDVAVMALEAPEQPGPVQVTARHRPGLH